MTFEIRLTDGNSGLSSKDNFLRFFPLRSTFILLLSGITELYSLPKGSMDDDLSIALGRDSDLVF